MPGDRSAARLSPALLLLGAAWMTGVAAGLLLLISYANKSGAVDKAPLRFPDVAGIEPSPDRSTLLMFAHPRCACSYASLEQLARIHVRCEGRVNIRVLFYCPAEAPEDWARTRLWEAAAGIPGTAVSLDPGGRIAAQFGSRISGEVVVYNSAGGRVFQGGITAARGHEGDNIGTAAVIACLRGETPQHERTPVFGCVLRAEDPADPRRPDFRGMPPTSPGQRS